jgi:hypothetical protein
VMPREETFAGAAVAGFFGRIRAATNHASRGGMLMRLPSGRAVQLSFLAAHIEIDHGMNGGIPTTCLYSLCELCVFVVKFYP